MEQCLPPIVLCLAVERISISVTVTGKSILKLVIQIHCTYMYKEYRRNATHLIMKSALSGAKQCLISITDLKKPVQGEIL